MTEWRKLGITLKEDELAALNMKMKQEGYASLGELIRGYIDGSFRPTEKAISDISERVASNLLANSLPTEQNTSSAIAVTRTRKSLGRDLIPRPIAYKRMQQSRLSKHKSNCLSLLGLQYLIESQPREDCTQPRPGAKKQDLTQFWLVNNSLSRFFSFISVSSILTQLICRKGL
jgi:hypothetical protein